MKTRTGLFIISLISATLILSGNLPRLLALEAPYNRPNPLLDYVPQELGIFDTSYDQLGEFDCRECHGNSMADRHHGLDSQRVDLDCLDCHEILPQAPFVTVTNDCKTSGCHSGTDVRSGNQRWHHNTDLAGSLDCVVCHNPNLIAELSPVRDLTLYPPSVVTPTPFSCENCHWEQERSGTHPQGPFGSYEKSIISNYDTHHQGFTASFVGQCSVCHALDPEDHNWDASDPELIRYCEKCHDINTLHSIGPHVQASDEWEAVGAHVGGSTDWTDVDPTTYRTFLISEKCNGCHADGVPDTHPPTSTNPVISLSANGLMPQSGSCGLYVTVRGQYFGATQGNDSEVQLSRDSVTWTIMPVNSWTDTLIIFRIPCGLIAPDNYSVRVITSTGASNHVTFVLKDGPTLSAINPQVGSVGDWITLTGNGFGSNQTEMINDDYGIHSFVEMVDSAGGSGENYVMLNYQNWSPTSLDVRFYDYFNDKANPSRDYLQNASGDEPPMYQAKDLFIGTYALYVVSIYFIDNDASDTFTAGDDITQVVQTQSEDFTLADVSSIWAIKPSKIEGGNVLKIFGAQFGNFQGQGVIYYGTQSDYDNDSGTAFNTFIRSWSNTRIEVNVPVLTSGPTLIWVVPGGDSDRKSEAVELEILDPL